MKKLLFGFCLIASLCGCNSKLARTINRNIDYPKSSAIGYDSIFYRQDILLVEIIENRSFEKSEVFYLVTEKMCYSNEIWSDIIQKFFHSEEVTSQSLFWEKERRHKKFMFQNRQNEIVKALKKKGWKMVIRKAI